MAITLIKTATDKPKAGTLVVKTNLIIKMKHRITIGLAVLTFFRVNVL